MKKQLRVLMVEDSEDDALLTIRELKRGGYDPVYERVDTPEGMTAALKNQLWDVIISDYVMPRFDGLAALKLFQGTGFDIPFIIVSGSIGEDIAVAAMKAGAQDYLMKGKLARLAPAIEQELREAEVRRRLKESEKAVKDAAQHWQMTFDAIQDGVCLLNEESRFLNCNQAMANLIGKPVSETLGCTCWELVHGTTEPIPDCPVQRSWNSLQRENLELPVGERILNVIVDPIIGAGGVPKGAVHIIDDITERKRAEEALRKSEDRYRNILQSIEEGYFEVDVAGNFVFFNDSLCRILGYSREEMMGMNNRQYMDPKNAQKVFQAFNQAYTTGEPHIAFDWEIIRKDGIKIFIESSVSLIKDSKGERIGFRGITRDITERKQIEESLREAEKRYRQVVENATEIIYSVDEKGNFTYGNPAGLKATGFSLKELQQFNYLDLVLPEYHERITGIYSKQLREKQATTYVEFPFFNKSGEVVWFGQNATLVIEDGKIAGFHIIARDITERKGAEEALREAEARYRSLFEGVPIGLYRTTPEGKILDANPALAQMLGYPDPKSLMAIGVRDTYPNPEDRTQWQKLVREKGVVQNFEKRLRCRDGSVIWVEENTIAVSDQNGQVLYYEGSFKNITGRKEMEEKVRESEEHYRQLVNMSPDGIALTDQQGRLVFASPRIYSIFESPPGVPIIGTSVIDWVSPEQRDIAKDRIQKLLASDVSPSSFEYKLLKYDGTPFWGELSSRVLVDAKGQTKGLMTIIHDITEKKKKEQEVSTLQEQLRQFQKMEAIGQLAGGIAHDFNNLLTIISGNCQLSLFDLKKGDPLHSNLEEIKKASERAADLTRQLLAFSRKQILEMKVLDLNQVLQRLDKMLHRIIGEDIVMEVIESEPLGKVKVDPGQIEQVIMNLVVNAKDAMPEGGKLLIETANVELDEEYAKKHISVIPGRYVVLSVSDTGEGIAPEIKEKIFEPFFTTKSMGKGTGLGLSTVYGIVKQSKGNIWVYSELGQGTTFKIYLPRVDEPLDELKDEIPKEIPGGSETILLVEDEETVLKLAVKVLKKQGYKVLEASDGGKALLLCEQYKEPIHLILTDVVMPGMSGRKLVERLRETHPEVKALYMSGYTDNAILHHGILEPDIKFLQKPFTLEGLTKKVRETLDV